MSEERTLRRSPRISKKRKLNEPYESSKKQKNDDSNEFKLPYNVARNPVEAKEKAIKMLSDCKKEKSIARIFGGMGSNFYFKKKINNKIEGIYMFQDDRGQYGNTEKFNKYKDFVRGYTII